MDFMGWYIRMKRNRDVLLALIEEEVEDEEIYGTQTIDPCFKRRL